MALRWTRRTFRAYRTEDGRYALHDVRGLASGPFGIYAGCYVIGVGGYTLVHVPTGCHLVTLPRQRLCKALAEELAGLRMQWDQSDPDRVAGADVERVRPLLRGYEERSRRPRLGICAGVGGRPKGL